VLWTFCNGEPFCVRPSRFASCLNCSAPMPNALWSSMTPRLRSHSSSRLLFDDSTVVEASRSLTASVAFPRRIGFTLNTVVATATTITPAVTHRVRDQLSTITTSAKARPRMPPRDSDSTRPRAAAAPHARATGRHRTRPPTAIASSGVAATRT
jgi:hypothetical protein